MHTITGSDSCSASLNATPGRALADAALRAGAIGFVLKDRADTELGEAIRQAARGLPYRSPKVSRPYRRRWWT